jgi:hypothetical protein
MRYLTIAVVLFLGACTITPTGFVPQREYVDRPQSQTIVVPQQPQQQPQVVVQQPAPRPPSVYVAPHYEY